MINTPRVLPVTKAVVSRYNPFRGEDMETIGSFRLRSSLLPVKGGYFLQVFYTIPAAEFRGLLYDTDRRRLRGFGPFPTFEQLVNTLAEVLKSLGVE